jgi:p-cumate 2,3-dioxygenase beta subunit
LNSLAVVTKEMVESFLYKEAELLDGWELDAWLELVAEGGAYYIPSNDIPMGNHKQHLFLIADDYDRMKARVKRLKSRHAHIENPHSRTRRFISNIRIKDREEDMIIVKSNFIVYRFRRYEQVSAFVGEYTHKLKLVGGELRIMEKKAVLDTEEVGSHGTISIIL